MPFRKNRFFVYTDSPFVDRKIFFDQKFLPILENWKKVGSFFCKNGPFFKKVAQKPQILTEQKGILMQKNSKTCGVPEKK